MDRYRPIGTLQGLADALCGHPEWGEGDNVESTLSMCFRKAVDRVTAEDPDTYAGVRLGGSVRLGEGPSERRSERWDAAIVPSAEADGVRVAAVRGPGGRWSAGGPYEVMAHLNAHGDGQMRGGAPVTRRQVEAWRQEDDPRIRKIRRMRGTTVVSFDAERSADEPGPTVVGLVVDVLGVPAGADPAHLLDKESSPWWGEAWLAPRMGGDGKRPSFQAVAEPLALPTTTAEVRDRMDSAIGDALAEWARMREEADRWDQ